jgi:hypothetical protein
MPKKSGEAQKTIRLPSLPVPKVRKIQSFDQAAPSGGTPKHADRVPASSNSGAAGGDGKIDPRQMKY